MEEVHSDNRVKFSNYFSGMYESELVALGVLSDYEIDTSNASSVRMLTEQ